MKSKIVLLVLFILLLAYPVRAFDTILPKNPIANETVVNTLKVNTLNLTITKIGVIKEQSKIEQTVRIYVTANGNPIAGAEIYANDKFIGYTNSNGTLIYKFEPGLYIIVAKKTGYFPSAELTLNISKKELLEKLEKEVGKIRKKLPPIIFMKELHPKYFVVGNGKSYTVSAIVCDESGVSYIKFLYSTDRVNWKEGKISIKNITTTNLLKFKLTPPQIYDAEGIIPPQKAGTVVFYKFIAEDKDGNKAEGPTGMYFVVNNKSKLKIMIVDPWVELWLLKINSEKYANTVLKMASYGIKADWLSKIYEGAKKARNFDLIKRHYWERLGKYNFIVVSPNEVEEALSFKPKVFILSNLLLSRWVVPHELIEYAREHNAGIVATHGTIFDEVVWVGDTRKEAIEVGARQNVGDTLDVYTPDKETVALLLGLKLSPIVEYARDKVAETLCESNNPQVKAAGRTLGSMPLFPAYVPFSGKIIVEEEHAVTKGLGKSFQVVVPMYGKKFKAYTTFGWQYVLPSNPVRVAEERAKIAKEKAIDVFKELSEFTGDYTGTKANVDAMSSSLNSKLLNATLNLSIKNGKIIVKIEGREIKLDNGKAKAVIEFFKKYMPVKVVAISNDCLAGVIVHDEWYRKDGVRTVYITFEPEASNSNAAWKLLENSVVWTSKFEYKANKVTKEMAELIKQMGGSNTIEKRAGTTTEAHKVKTPGFEAILGVAVLLLVLRKMRK